MATNQKPDQIATSDIVAKAPDASPPATTEDPAVAELKAQIAAQAAQIEKLTELATRPAQPSPYDLAAIAEMAQDGSRNARSETAPVPLHFTHGTPLFNAARPTGRAG